MQSTSICLQINCQCLSCHRFFCNQAFPVIHINPLIDFSINKQEKLWILCVIPFINLRRDADPHTSSFKLLRHGICRTEPVVPVLPIPVHCLTVKAFPACRILQSILRAKEIPLLIVPLQQGKCLPDPSFFQFLAYYASSLIQKFHLHTS